jgi:3-deoxy-manno-octulosonate cytidylyltransferase (CMP-KDO synthetase)
VLIVTSDIQVSDYCNDKKIPFIETPSSCKSGTERCAFAADLLAKSIGDDFMITNWQVDEPLVNPKHVVELMDLLNWSDEGNVGTLFSIPDKPIWDYDCHTVKVALDRLGDSEDRCRECYWFSRAPMISSLIHCGIYVYTYRDLMNIQKMETSVNSELESLEQLTWIENGFRIHGLQTDSTPSINTIDDWNAFCEAINL